MSFASFIIQLLNGLAAAASLFLVSAGLSLIFGVTRIVNFAHGSLYMLGLYGAYSLIQALGLTTATGTFTADTPTGLLVLNNSAVGLPIHTQAFVFDAGSTSCAPWHDAQVAILAYPSAVTSPWNVSRYVDR